MNRNYLIIGSLAVVLIVFLGWLFIISTKPQGPLPGVQVEDLGRDHITDISGKVYNSNPPTSGPHFPVWAKKGVYDRVLSDGYLIHTLEHGYIVLSYNCDKKEVTGYRLQVTVYAHEGEPVEIHNIATSSAQPLMQMKAVAGGEMSWFTPNNAPEKEVELPESFNSNSCKELVRELGSFLDDYQRIVVVPRPNMDTKIALTAWTRLEKLNSFDRERIKTFIDAFQNKGPEKTIE